MCNLYRMTKNTDEVAKWFDAIAAMGGANFSEEVYPGYPGLVVADGAVKSMTWGFPLVMKGKNGQPLKPKPVNNARTDKLDSFFWRYSFEERRCLIPLSAWAEAEGPKGSKTRTWLSLPGDELFAAAGVWGERRIWPVLFDADDGQHWHGGGRCPCAHASAARAAGLCWLDVGITGRGAWSMPALQRRHSG